MDALYGICSVPNDFASYLYDFPSMASIRKFYRFFDKGFHDYRHQYVIDYYNWTAFSPENEIQDQYLNGGFSQKKFEFFLK